MMDNPNQWKIKTLGELGSCHNGLTYKPENVVSDGGILVLRSSNIQESRLSFNDNVYVDVDIPEKLIVKNGDILVCVRNGSRSLIGKSAVIEQEQLDKKMTFGAFMSIYRTEYHDYIRHLFHSDMYYQQIRNNLGATINQITNKNLNSFIFPFPENEYERKKIAEILSTVDKKIDLIDEKIAETEKFKTGLVQKLFTSSSVKMKLGELLDEKPTYGANASASKYNEGDVRYVRITDINEKGRLLPKKVSLNISNIEDYILKEDDIIIARSGNTVGKSYLYNSKDGKCAYAGYLIRFRVDKSKLMPEYLSQYLMTKEYWSWIKSNIKVGAQPNINAQQYQSLQIPMLDLDKQQDIVEILTTTDEKLELLAHQKSVTQDVKKGLMQKLLTGEWRIPVDNLETA